MACCIHSVQELNEGKYLKYFLSHVIKQKDIFQFFTKCISVYYSSSIVNLIICKPGCDKIFYNELVCEIFLEDIEHLGSGFQKFFIVNC